MSFEIAPTNKYNANTQKNVHFLNEMPEDIEEIFFKTADCKTRSKYCVARGKKNGTICGREDWQYLHKKRCEASKRRPQLIFDSNSKPLNLLLDYVEADVDTKFAQARDEEMMSLLIFILGNNPEENMEDGDVNTQEDEEKMKKDDWGKLFESVVINGHLEVVNRLLDDRRVDPTLPDYILYASENGHSKVVEKLLEWEGTGNLEGKRVDPTDYRKNHAIRAASENGHSEVVEKLLGWKGTGNLQDERVDPTVYSNYAIYAASKKGDLKTVGMLLEWKGEGKLAGKRVDPTAYSNCAIRYASQKGHSKVVEKLLKWNGEGKLAGKRVDLTDFVDDMIRDAQQKGHSEIVDLLRSYKK